MIFFLQYIIYNKFICSLYHIATFLVKEYDEEAQTLYDQIL
jgi:hypothetical protein